MLVSDGLSIAWLIKMWWLINNVRKRTPKLSITYLRSPLWACGSLFLAAAGFFVGVGLFRCRLFFIFGHFFNQAAATGAATRRFGGE